MICVVEDPKDVSAIEKTGEYAGVYHVLLGALSPLDGIGPEQIMVYDLLDRVKKKKIREIILATNPNTEGDTTALYLARVLAPLKVKVTRIARGIPWAVISVHGSGNSSQALSGRQPAIRSVRGLVALVTGVFRYWEPWLTPWRKGSGSYFGLTRQSETGANIGRD